MIISLDEPSKTVSSINTIKWRSIKKESFPKALIINTITFKYIMNRMQLIGPPCLTPTVALINSDLRILIVCLYIVISARKNL